MLSSFQHTKYDSSNVTVYEIGCTRAMSRHYAQTVSIFLKLLVAALIVELSLTVTFRYLQTSTGTAIEEDDMEAETRGYLWTTSRKQSKQLATADKDSKSQAVAKKGAAKSEKDKNRNNVRLNNNNFGPQSNYNNMTMAPTGRVNRLAEVGTKTVPTRDMRVSRPATVARKPSSATLQTSRQTSGTNVSGTSRLTSGTRQTVTTQDSNTRSTSRQPSSNAVATRSTSAVPPSAATSSSYASTIRRVPNASRNNNDGVAAQSSSSSVAAAQEKFQSETASDLPNETHQQEQRHQQQQQQQEVILSEVHAQRSSAPVVLADQHNAETKQRPKVSRPLTPIPIPEVHQPAKLASLRLPSSIPLADFLVSPRSSLSLAGSANSNVSNENRPMPHDKAPSTGWNNAAMQPAPLAAAVHKPLAGVHTPSTYRIVSSTAAVQESPAPPSLPPRNVSITEDSPYVMMYPLRPPRNHPTTTPHRK